MSMLVSYFVLGLSLAAPIGPINAAQINTGIKNGFWQSWLVGLGAMVADALYMLLIYFVQVRFLNLPFVQNFLWLFGCFVLTYTGVESLISAGTISSDQKNSGGSSWKSFLSGFLISLTNPLTILFWLGIYGSVLAKTAVSYSQHELMLYSAAILLGITVWDIAMATVASSFRRFLTSHILTGISILSGLSLIGFGFYFGFQAFHSLFLN